jgi:GxxExxY protein
VFGDIMVNESEVTRNKPISESVNDVSGSIVDAAYTVHKYLGPGLLEGVYEVCLAYELRERGHIVETELAVPVIYKGIRLEAGLRLDMLVDNCVIIELKAIEKLAPIHEAQVLTYLKLTGHRVGLLINFNSCQIKDGIKRMVC